MLYLTKGGLYFSVSSVNYRKEAYFFGQDVIFSQQDHHYVGLMYQIHPALKIEMFLQRRNC